MFFQIKINGQSFSFPHRLSAKEITRLEIRGDIQINRLSFKNLDGHVQVIQTGQPTFNPPPYHPEGIEHYSQPSPGISQPQPYGAPQPNAGFPPNPYGAPQPNDYGVPPQGGFYPSLNNEQKSGDPRGYY
jgi:hypothetical protein